MMTWRAKIRTENGTLPGLGTSEGISNQPLNSVKSFFHSLGIFIASWKYISSLYPSSVPRGVKRSRQNSNCGPLSLSRMCGILCGLKTVWRKIRAKSLTLMVLWQGEMKQSIREVNNTVETVLGSREPWQQIQRQEHDLEETRDRMPSKKGKTISHREIRKGSMTIIPGMLWESFELLLEIFTLGISFYKGASPPDQLSHKS